MQAKLEDVIETAMSLPLESQMKLAELLQKNVIEQREAANSPMSLNQEWYDKIHALYEAGETEKANKLKRVVDNITACAKLDEPDLDIDEIYRERERNVARESVFN